MFSSNLYLIYLFKFFYINIFFLKKYIFFQLLLI